MTRRISARGRNQARRLDQPRVQRRISARGRIPAAISLALLALTAACSSPTSPTPTPGAPSITCPVDVTVQSLDGSAKMVSFTLPVAGGGAAPVNVACEPASGTSFTPGAKVVTCTATDTLMRTATCGFSIRVTVPPKLKATRFLAFGDSMTEGVVSAPAPSYRLFATPESYPSRLHPMLGARYVAQTIAMTNSGQAGEWAVSGVARLSGLLQSLRPEAVLLMEGANDLNNLQEAGIPLAAAAMEQMVKASQAVGAAVFLATLPAQRAVAQRANAPQAIAPYNDQMNAVASRTGAVLVDVYAAIGNPPPTTLIGADGLHPTEAGYVKIAEAFFQKIREKLETPGVLTSDVAAPPVLGRIVPDEAGATLTTRPGIPRAMPRR